MLLGGLELSGSNLNGAKQGYIRRAFGDGIDGERSTTRDHEEKMSCAMQIRDDEWKVWRLTKKGKKVKDSFFCMMHAEEDLLGGMERVMFPPMDGLRQSGDLPWDSRNAVP